MRQTRIETYDKKVQCTAQLRKGGLGKKGVREGGSEGGREGKQDGEGECSERERERER